MQYGLYIFDFDDQVRAGYINGYIYFNSTLPLANASIKSLLNNKEFLTDENGFFDFGFPSGNQLFIINEQDTVEIDIFPQQENQINIYLGDDINLGDINNDSIVNVLDVILVINFILQTNSPTLSEFWAADLNQDNLINIQDIILIIQSILEL